MIKGIFSSWLNMDQLNRNSLYNSKKFILKYEYTYYIKNYLLIDWGLGIGDWGLGIGPTPQSPIPNPQSPIPNPQSPFSKCLAIGILDSNNLHNTYSFLKIILEF